MFIIGSAFEFLSMRTDFSIKKMKRKLLREKKLKELWKECWEFNKERGNLVLGFQT